MGLSYLPWKSKGKKLQSEFLNWTFLLYWYFVCFCFVLLATQRRLTIPGVLNPGACSPIIEAKAVLKGFLSQYFLSVLLQPRCGSSDIHLGWNILFLRERMEVSELFRLLGKLWSSSCYWYYLELPHSVLSSLTLAPPFNLMYSRCLSYGFPLFKKS